MKVHGTKGPPLWLATVAARARTKSMLRAHATTWPLATTARTSDALVTTSSTPMVLSPTQSVARVWENATSQLEDASVWTVQAVVLTASRSALVHASMPIAR